MPSPLAPRSTSRKPAIKFQVKHQGVEGEALRLAVHLMAFALLPTGCIAYTAVLACSSDPAVRLSVAMDSGRAQVVALSLFSRACSISWVAHRLLAHRSYHPTRRFRFLLALWACGAWSGSPFAWAAKHRVHHKLSDTPDDPEVMDMHAPMHALSRSRAACPIRPHTPQPFHSHRANEHMCWLLRGNLSLVMRGVVASDGGRGCMVACRCATAGRPSWAGAGRGCSTGAANSTTGRAAGRHTTGCMAGVRLA
jgi:hypothetical protein